MENFLRDLTYFFLDVNKLYSIQWIGLILISFSISCLLEDCTFIPFFLDSRNFKLRLNWFWLKFHSSPSMLMKRITASVFQTVPLKNVYLM